MLLKLPVKVKFRGSEILSLTKSRPVSWFMVPPFQACTPRKKFPVLAHHSALSIVLLMKPWSAPILSGSASNTVVPKMLIDISPDAWARAAGRARR